MSDRATFVSFLLDETGSMSSIADDTVHGLNTYVEKLQEGDANIVFSLVSFNSNETRRRYVAEPVRSVPPMERKDYRPDAMTPLIDAAVKIIRATDEAVRHREDDPNVVVVMQTDGKENASVEHSHGDLALLIKEKTAVGWQFVFLGAGLDAFAVARQAGIDIHPGQVVSYGRAMSREVFAETAQNVSDYAESGDADLLSFSPRQRDRVGDVHRRVHLERRRSPRSAGRQVQRSKTSAVEEIDLTRS